MARTLYDVLMVSPLADRQLVGVVYRHLAKRYHPDIDPSPEAAARMAELNEAYTVLSDPARRDAYDEQLDLAGLLARSHLGPGSGNTKAAGRPAASSRPAEPTRPGESPRRPGEPVSRPSEAAARPSEGAMGPAGSAGFGEAGPPPVNPAPAGPALTFGRYRGWSLNQVARYDRDYIEWLSRTTMGRTYRRELDALLRRP